MLESAAPAWKSARGGTSGGRRARVVVLLVVATAAGCGKDEPLAPANDCLGLGLTAVPAAGAPPSARVAAQDGLPVGSWRALTFRLTSLVNPAVAADPVRAGGATFVLDIRDSGTYSAEFNIAGCTTGESGSIFVSEGGDTLVLRPVGAPEGRAAFEVRADTLILDGEARWDFNGDQQREDARLHAELVLQSG